MNAPNFSRCPTASFRGIMPNLNIAAISGPGAVYRIPSASRICRNLRSSLTMGSVPRVRCKRRTPASPPERRGSLTMASVLVERLGSPVHPTNSGSVGARVRGLVLVVVVFAGVAGSLLGPRRHVARPEYDRAPAVDPHRERRDLMIVIERPFDLQRVVHVDRREVLLGPPPRRRELDAVVRAVRRRQCELDALVEVRIPVHRGHGAFDRDQILL